MAQIVRILSAPFLNEKDFGQKKEIGNQKRERGFKICLQKKIQTGAKALRF